MSEYTVFWLEILLEWIKTRIKNIKIVIKL